MHDIGVALRNVEQYLYERQDDVVVTKRTLHARSRAFVLTHFVCFALHDMLAIAW